MADDTPAVELQALTKVYPASGKGRAEVRALTDATLTIQRGEIFALLGPNGAGKTTLIGCVAGLVRATSGTAKVLGHDVWREYQKTRQAVGLVPQEINFDPFFNVRESVRLQAGYFGVKLADDKLEEILRALGLWEKRDSGSRALSGGMKRRLLIAKALAHGPRVLFLDEPTAGVDVELRRTLWEYVRVLRERGTTIVLTTHYLEEAEELADRVGFIDQGRILLVSGKEDVLARFGKRTLRLMLSRAALEVPPALAQKGAKLVSDGTVLELTQPSAEALGPVMSQVLAAGLEVRDMEVRRTGLEEIYVDLVGKKNGSEANP